MPLSESSKTFQELSRVAGTLLNPRVTSWKEGGGKVMGYYCSFVPEEIFVAANLVPFRIRGTGSTGTELADQYYTQVSCSFARNSFDQALSGEYDFLDGLVVGTSCDTIRHTYENWRHAGLKTPFTHLLHRPHVSGELQVEYYRRQLEKLKCAVEEHFGVPVTDDKLWEAIALCDETRRLQQALYALRRQPVPPISGSETVAVMVAGVSMPKAQYNEALRVLLSELGSVPPNGKPAAARLMIVGCSHDDPTLCQIVESQGGDVVADFTCFGGKTMLETVGPREGDPLLALARYGVIGRPFCPKVGGAHPRRLDAILGMVRDYKVDGVIGQVLVSCDPWGGELFLLKDELREAGVPMLKFEREYLPSSLGQLTTRVQAFLETVRR